MANLFSSGAPQFFPSSAVILFGVRSANGDCSVSSKVNLVNDDTEVRIQDSKIHLLVNGFSVIYIYTDTKSITLPYSLACGGKYIPRYKLWMVSFFSTMALEAKRGWEWLTQTSSFVPFMILHCSNVSE